VFAVGSAAMDPKLKQRAGAAAQGVPLRGTAIGAHGSVVRGTLTRYDPSFPATGGGDEKTLQSRPKTSQGATPQSVEAEGRQRAQSCIPGPFIPWPDRARAAHPRAG
jgi:hypothetical protein